MLSKFIKVLVCVCRLSMSTLTLSVILCVLSVLGPSIEYVTKYSTVIYIAKNVTFLYLILVILCKVSRKNVIVCVLPAALLVLSFLLNKSDTYLETLRTVGFRARLVLDSSLAGHCHPAIFIASNKTQELAFCQSLVPLGYDFAYNFVFDTSGEITLPPRLRDAEWTKAMNTFPGGRYFSRHELNVRQIKGKFYNVIIDFNDGDSY